MFCFTNYDFLNYSLRNFSGKKHIVLLLLPEILKLTELLLSQFIIVFQRNLTSLHLNPSKYLFTVQLLLGTLIFTYLFYFYVNF